MAKIKHSDLIEDKILAKTIAEFDALLKVSSKVKQNFTDILKVQQKALKGGEPNKATEYKKQAEAVKAIANAEKALLQVEEQKIKIQKQEKDIIIKANKEKERQLTLSKKQAAAAEKQAQKIKALQQPYKKLSDRLLTATKAYQNVAAAEGTASAKAIKYKKALDRLDKRLKTIDANAGRFQRNVGNYAKGMQSLSTIAVAAGGTLGLAGVFNLFKEGIGTMRNFEQANANLASVLGKTREEIKPLTESAKELGAITEFSATQVTSLQDAYSRLGFSQSEILNVQESTLQGATALQAELGASSELVGGTLRSFSEDSGQAQRFVDVLAKSTSTTALNFEKLATALPIVGKTADVAGVSFERTAAQLGVLSNNNIDASTSGSALRNIYLDLSKKGITYDEAMNKIATSTNKLKTANELFGKRGATVALTLADSTEKVNELEEAYENAGGTAEKMAETQLATLEGSIKLLSSAWEGFILSLNDGDKVTGKLAKGIKWLSENLTDVLKAIWAVVKVFAIYKTTMFAIAKAQKLAAIATALYTKATSKATKATKLFNKASKANIIGAVITLLFAAYEAFQYFSKGANEAAEAQKKLNEQLEEYEDLQESALSLEERFNKLGNLNNRQRKDLINDIQTAINATEDRTVSFQKEFEQLKLNNAEYQSLKLQLTGVSEVSKEKGGAYYKQQQRLLEIEKEFATALSQGVDKRAALQAMLEKITLLKEKDKDSTDNNTKSNRENSESIDKMTASNKALSVSIEESKDQEKEYGNTLLENLQLYAKMGKAVRDRIKQAKEDAAAQKEAREKDVLATAQLLSNELISIWEEEYAKKQALLDKEIEQSKSHQAELKILARNGIEDASDSLAFEQKKQAELELQKAEETKKIERAKFATEFVKVYLANAQVDPTTALAKTTKDIILIKAAAQSLSSLDVGSEDTSEANQSHKINDGKGGFLAVLHKKERVMTANQNALTKGISNEKLAQLGKEYNEGNKYQTNSEILRSFASLENAVKDIKTTSFEHNKLTGMIETIIATRHKRIVTHQKTGGLFSN